MAPDQRICCIFIAHYVVRPVLEYACPVWHPSLTAGQLKKIESLQQRAMKIIFPDKDYSLALVFASVDWLESRRDYLSERFFRRCVLREWSCLRTLPASGQTALGHYRQAIYDMQKLSSQWRLKLKNFASHLYRTSWITMHAVYSILYNTDTIRHLDTRSISHLYFIHCINPAFCWQTR